jgi:8-oxo-dGTP pyrophosphatase MutT (NUDIX family)
MAIGKWKKIETIEQYDCGGFYRIDKDSVITPGKRQTTYHSVRHPKKSVMIVPRDNKGNFYMTRQHRYSMNEYSLEFPSGSVDTGESLLIAAKRELAEEMRLASVKWKKLGTINAIPGISDLKMDIFLADDIFPIDTESKDPIDVNLHETVILKNKELFESIGDKIKAALSIAAFQLFQTNSKKFK